MYSSGMKMTDVVMSNPFLVLILPRFGITLDFADKSVAEVCKSANISCDLFLMVCNVYSYGKADTKNQNFCNEKFISYLRVSHNFYIHERIPHINQHLHQIAKISNNKYGEILIDFFTKYKQEITEHFKFEEEILFPYLYKPTQIKKSQVSLADTHNNIKHTLDDISRILFKYLPKNVASEEIAELLFDILQLSQDLSRHTMIEEIALGVIQPATKKIAIQTNTEELSTREKEILILIAKGLTTKEIADKLCISTNTVNSHRKNIISKIGIRSVAGLTVFALFNKLI